MTTKYLDIKGKWGVVVCYDLKPLDEFEMRQLMMALGMHGQELDDAVETLLYQENSGMCITSMRQRMSLVFIGNATSEDAAWLTGYLMRKVVQIIGEPCR